MFFPVKILLAEDEPVLAAFLRNVLSKYGSCHHVSDGLAAVEAFELARDEGEPFDLLVLDIMMPEVSGHDALHEIRAIEHEHNVPPSDGVKVMMCSALGDAENIYTAHSNGCVEYLVKPVGKKDLVKSLGRLGFAPLDDTNKPDA